MLQTVKAVCLAFQEKKQQGLQWSEVSGRVLFMELLSKAALSFAVTALANNSWQRLGSSCLTIQLLAISLLHIFADLSAQGLNMSFFFFSPIQTVQAQSRGRILQLKKKNLSVPFSALS